MPETDLVVFQLAGRESRCDECKRELWKGNLLRKEGEKGLCIDCADLGHLVFVPAGDACVTRRASKYSSLRVVVLRWSRSRRRYERQGILVQQEALARAEQECLDDEELRARRREIEAERRAERASVYVEAFAAEIRKRYPKAPPGAAETIAAHACQVHSKRIGRTAQAKDFDPSAIDLAVQAHVRHHCTNYDDLMSAGLDRVDARSKVGSTIREILANWKEAQ